MDRKDGMKTPELAKDFVTNLDAGLGDRLVGVILFGSHAKKQASDNSDIDLAVIIADVDGERTRQEVFRILSASEVDRSMVSLSVETYLRIKEFLKKGDPFAWVVVSEGKILKERGVLVTDLKNYCNSFTDGIPCRDAARYLQSKSYNHYMQAMQAFHQFLSNIQLSEMAGAQAVAIDKTKGTISCEKITALADWSNLKAVLLETAATKREIETLESLIMAHKQIRSKDRDYAGKELMEMVQVVGELWQRLLPKTTAEL